VELIAGVDEVGRGPLAGPVIACAVILPKEHSIKGLRDSKKLSKKRREELFPIIQKQAISIGIGESDVKSIDKINIREATFVAMKNALEQLDPKPERALIDGESLKDYHIPNEGIVGGDDKIDSIKAASIIAKVTRDNIMKEYSLIFPEYGFENNSGYGTKSHMEALEKYKATPIHRKSFKPVTSQMPTFDWLIENKRIDWIGIKLAALYLKKHKYKEIQITNEHPYSDEIHIECCKNKRNTFINVITSYNNNLERPQKRNLDESMKIFKNSLLKKSHDDNNSIFGQIHIELKKGGPKYHYTENIFLD
tara:strand:- start:393 stop:1316 length:924 start_codon:yes stop_codon:yes gene_type:complete